METNALENKEVLVLSDDEGNYYAIPSDDLQKYRVSGDALHKLGLGDDVTGYSMANNFLAQQLSSQRDPAHNLQAQQLADLRAEGEKNEGQEPDQTQRGGGRSTPRRMFSGVMVALGLISRG